MVVALVAAACGANDPVGSGGAPASPLATAPNATTSTSPSNAAASVRPSASPSSRIDVVEAFRAKMAATQAFEATIDGTVKVGGTSVAATGTLQVSGSDSHQVMTIATAKPQTTETITVDGTTYTRRGDAWFGAPATSSTTFGDAFAATLARLTDLGPVSIDGRRLHRLAPPPGTTIPMTSLGTSPGPAGGTMTVEFYANDDGTPAIIALDATWTQKAANVDQKASMHLDFALRDGATLITIAAPSPIWVTGNSKRLAYTLSYPSEWDVELARKGSDPDYYYGVEGQSFAVTRAKKCACTLNAMTTELIRYQRGHVKGFTVARNSTTRVAGLRARVFESRGRYPGGRAWDLTYVVVRGKYVYVLDYSSERPLTKQDRALADQLVASVAFR